MVVLDDGSPAGDGSHAELMALGQRYAELFDVQARGYTDAGVPR
jgi:ABC-type multidrug transport system fused ATPase/permease subunit